MIIMLGSGLFLSQCLLYIEMNMTDHAKSAAQKMPPGIPYIIGNEAAERFSYYGMRTILVMFMTKYLIDQSGAFAPMNEQEAKTWYHIFSMANYFFPIIGALVADIFWGKYKTIITLSIVYCLGHAALAMWETRFGLSIGLTLIAVGAGGIKPCVSAHVGDQFSKENSGLVEKIFSAFYFSINFGSFFSTLLTPVLLKNYGPSLAFGVPGILMAVATFVFWLGRHKFVSIPPVGWQQYKRDVFSPDGMRAIGQLSIIFLFISVFWSLYDQTGSSWVLQAEHMNRMVDLRFGPFQMEWLSFELLSSQIQALNPIMVMAFIPLFSFLLYPVITKIFPLSPLRKIGIGLFLTATSFMLIATAEQLIQAGQTPSIMWQFWSYVLITLSEVMVSVTALEFAYTQAPAAMKSFITSFYLLAVSLGNFITAMINGLAQGLTGAAYFWFFAALMVGTAIVFIFAAKRYKGKTYLQDHSSFAN